MKLIKILFNKVRLYPWEVDQILKGKTDTISMKKNLHGTLCRRQTEVQIKK